VRLASRWLFAFLVAVAATAQASAPATENVAPSVLLSRQILRDAHLAIGDVVFLSADPAGARRLPFRIAGVYEPTPDPLKYNVERFEARLHLPDLIALTADPADPQSAESVTAVNVKLVNPADADRFSSDVTRRSIGLIVRPTARAGEGDPFTVLERFHVAIATVTIVGSTAFLLALMVIRAEERRDTVGMLRLIGISRSSIVVEILIEGVVVAIGGAIFGVVLAAAAQYAINRFFQARYDTALVFVRVTGSIVARCLLIALPVGVATGAAAAWTLLRRVPASLIRR
jgi:ABC-type lipoprotein release transport system permease subunit